MQPDTTSQSNRALPPIPSLIREENNSKSKQTPENAGIGDSTDNLGAPFKMRLSDGHKLHDVSQSTDLREKVHVEWSKRGWVRFDGWVGRL